MLEFHAPPLAQCAIRGCVPLDPRRPTVHAMRLTVYERLWTEAELRGHGGLAARLHGEATLFRVLARGAGQSEHGGPLSLKTVRSGKSVYRVGRREYTVVPGRMLLMPPGERYTTRVGACGAEILTFYFPGALYAQMLAASVLPLDRLLEGAGLRPGDLCGFPPHQRPADPRVDALLARLDRSECDLTQLAQEVLAATVEMVRESAGCIARAPASRGSVRKELYRRVSWARARIEDELARGVSLTELARTACLSPFHLHRAFTEIFGETPGAYRQRRRLEVSRDLLLRSEAPVGEIAQRVGFRDPSAFTRAFRRACGRAPGAFRRFARR